ncbi:MarR family transcriptional regulator [Hyphococcus flavus]|uniref:MarR family transcriptional regulator n=1 Tax=Hyphococcus flavus TaxID=1866326 RepID=A0AAE9ZA66_9PROT|nr:MarR family transcriptional regulator [Hyphococcus flavus]WDI30429.1 MarR family transcriptional regulator [Hyphococcus flavus]
MTVACVSRQSPPGKKRELVLENFAPYRIVSLGHAISGRLAQAYRNESITIPEWRVLAVVAQATRLASRDVVKMTPMDKMTVSRAVASLEEKSLVKRTPNENDRRLSMLSLSEEGRALFDRVASLALQFEDNLLAALEDEEAALFRSALKKLEEQVHGMDGDAISKISEEAPRRGL